MKKNSNLVFGIFAKLSIAFIAVGLVPLLAVSVFFLEQFADNAKQIVLGDADIVLRSAGSYVDAMLEDWEESTRQLYLKPAEPGISLADLLLDETMPEQQRRQYIRKFLVGMDSVRGLKSVRFLDQNGNLYYFSASVGKILNADKIQEWVREEMENRDLSHDMMLEAVHEDLYFSNINDQVITVKRNLFDVSSLKTVDDLLGTLYLDISVDAVGQQLNGIELGSRSGFYIIDRDGAEIYRSRGQASVPEEVRRMLAAQGEGMQEDSQYYYSCRDNVSGGWMSVLRIHRGDIQKNIDRTRQYILTLLGASTVGLVFLYLLFSRRISRPIYRLKEGMEKIQKGDLDTRVRIESRDEVGVLAEGLNQMAAQLGIYIDRVYRAEIRQREAELNALKSQIKPHYLYNTLEVIRMTALGNEDQQAAEMIESLANQFRYLMGQEGDMVPLERELDNIRNYFMIVRIRFENRIGLKISIPEELLQEPVLKLILQPVVENAVKHGLRPKSGNGNVWITASSGKDRIELTVMDDGVGMNQTTLKDLQEKLEDSSFRQTGREEKGGVGLCNVGDRIRNKYGKEYGISVESTPGTGTIVILRLPVLRERKDELQDGDD